MDKNELDRIVDFCSGFANPVILFDKDWNVVFCNKKNFVTSKTNVQNLTMSGIKKLKSGESFLMVVNGKQYCSRVSVHGELYLCELFSSEDLLDIADKSDIYEKILPFINNFEHNIAVMWGSFSTLKKKL
ncbi:MAG: hypothetical protein ACI4JZ_09105, partial [Oscillospiraceae bacterium]